MCSWIGMVLLLLAFNSQADIYRSEDRFGRTTFSDRPSRGAEEIDLDTAPYRYKVHVTHIIDGDTVVLENGDKIRLIGINTPEVESRFTRAEAGGELARSWLQNRLHSAEVWLEYDAEQLDKYDRKLAHLFLASGEYLNASLLAQGLAMLTLTPPNLRYSQSLITAQQQAQTANKGIWQRTEFAPKKLADLEPGRDYRGWQRWLVTPSRINETRKYMNLVVSDHFVIKIAKSHQSYFPSLTTYLKQPLEVRGWLRRRGNEHFMIVQHPSAIQHR